MTGATSRQPIRRHRRTRLANKVLIFSLWALGFSSILFFGTVHAQAAPDFMLGWPPHSVASRGSPQSGATGQLFQPEAAGHCERGPRG